VFKKHQLNTEHVIPAPQGRPLPQTAVPLQLPLTFDQHADPVHELAVHD
jgi:hypothetical protein